HPGLGRLLRERLVGEDVDPDLAAALDLARHRDTGGLDVPLGDPAFLERLDAVVAEVDRCLAGREAAAPAAVHLPELRLLRERYEPCPLARASSLFLSATCCLRVVVSGASATGAGVVSTVDSITGCSRPS